MLCLGNDGGNGPPHHERSFIPAAATTPGPGEAHCDVGLFSYDVGKVSKNNHFIVFLLTANSIKVVLLINLVVSSMCYLKTK